MQYKSWVVYSPCSAVNYNYSKYITQHEYASMKKYVYLFLHYIQMGFKYNFFAKV